jgi:hypothetical protein
MIDFIAREADALAVSKELEGMPIDKLVDRANKALVDKQWPTAMLLLCQVSAKAASLGSYAMQQETELLKGAMNGTQEG